MRETFNNPAPDEYTDREDSSDLIQRRAMLKQLLRGRWHWAILFAVLLGGVGGYLGYNSQEDLYSSSSYIDVKPNYNIAINVKDLSVYEPYVNFVRSEMRRLKSEETIELAMQQQAWQDAVAQRPADSDEVTVRSFAGNLTLTSPERNEISIRVSYESQDPVTASAAINSLFAAYRQMQKQGQSSDIEDSIRLLSDRLEKRLEDQAGIRMQKELIIPGDEELLIRDRYERKRSELSAMEFKLGEIELALKPYLNNDTNSLTVKDLMENDPDMIELRKEQRALEETYVYLTEVLNRGETMRDVVQVRRAIAMVDRKVAELEASWLARGQDATMPLPPAVQQLTVQREALLARIDKLTAETQDISRRLMQVKEFDLELNSIADSIRKTRDEIQQFEESKVTLRRNEDITRIVIGPEATTPTTPWNAQKRQQLAGVGAIGGVFVGFGLVVCLGLLDRRLRHASDAAVDMPDANVLGILPTLPADLSDPDDAEAAAHCVHHIRTLLQIGGSNRVFSITSPSAGSGKSSLATALGMSFAATGVRTLLIDCDLVGAGLSRRMGTVVHESLDKVIRRSKLMGEAELSQLMTRAATQDKSLEQVLRESEMLTQDQIEGLLRLQKDTSLGLLDACGPGKLRPPVNHSRSDELLIMLDGEDSDFGDSSLNSNSPMIEYRSITEYGRLRECFGSTDIENLFVLPVGKARPADASRLSPAAMRELIRQAREAFDIVLIDTGPVLGSIEASIAAAEADATVMIVSRGDQKSLATRSLAQLRSVRAQIAGLVFNHALERDLDHASYASLVSQERRPDRSKRKKLLDKKRSARLGPLGTAVASFSDEDANSDNGAYTHANSASNGHDA